MANLYPHPKFTLFDDNGNPAVGWKVHTYEPGTTTNKLTYTDGAKSATNVNPVILDARGEADIWFEGYYKIVVKDENDNTKWTVDNFRPGASGFTTYPTKSDVAALSLTAANDGDKIFITSADGGEFTVRYNATPSTYADDGGSFCGTQFIPAGGDGTIGIVRDDVTVIKDAWFGTVGDGTTDDTTALQNFINHVINNSSVGEIAPKHYKFTRLYLSYDAVNNTGVDSTDGFADGSWQIFGSGVMGYAQYVNGDRIGTVLETTATTGDIIIHNAGSTDIGLRKRNKQFGNLSLIGTTTGKMMSIEWWHTNSVIRDIFIYNNSASGSGLYVNNSWESDFTRIYARSTATTNTGRGIEIQNTKDAPTFTGAGLVRCTLVTANRFGTGWQIGSRTYNDGVTGTISNTKLVDCQATTCGEGGRIGWGAESTLIDNFFAESCTTASLRIGDGARATKVIGGRFVGDVTDAHIGVGFNSVSGLYNQSQEYGTTIIEPHVWCPDTAVSASGVGIRIYDNSNSPTKVIGGTLVPMSSSPPNGVGISLEGTHVDTLILGPRFVALATDVSNPTKAALYTAQDNKIYIGDAVVNNSGDIEELITGYATVASATTINVDGANFINVTGTTNITTINTAKQGKEITLKFNDVLTVNDDTGNLRLAGNFTTSNADTLTLKSDGTNWYEKCRSTN